jgi:hypothetical protein
MRFTKLTFVYGALACALSLPIRAEAANRPWTAQPPLAPADSTLFYGEYAFDGNFVLASTYKLGAGHGFGVDVLQVASGGFDHQATIPLPDSVNRDFGHVLAVDGDTAVIGADTTFAPDPPIVGSVFVYVRSGGSWALQQELKPPDGQIDAGRDVGGDHFGETVAIQGDTLLVGAPNKRVGNNDEQGVLYVFGRSGASWSLEQEISTPDGVADDVFGWNIALDGDTFVAGVPHRNGTAIPRQGALYVYVRSGTQWSLQQELFAPDPRDGDGMGNAVALLGDTAVAAAYTMDEPTSPGGGGAYVWSRSGGTWSLQQKVYPTSVSLDSGGTTRIGASVGLTADTLLLGGPSDVVGTAPDAGEVFVFDLGAGHWSQSQILRGSRSDQSFGGRIHVVNDLALIENIPYTRAAAPAGDDAGTDAGAGADAASSNPGADAAAPAGEAGGGPPIGAQCSNDLRQSIAASGTITLCAPYACDPATGACRTASPAAAAPTNQGAGAGCGCSSGSDGSNLAGLVFLPALAWLARARRNALKSPERISIGPRGTGT